MTPDGRVIDASAATGPTIDRFGDVVRDVAGAVSHRADVVVDAVE